MPLSAAVAVGGNEASEVVKIAMVDADFNVLVALFIWLVGGAELAFTGRYVFLIALQPVYPLALLDTHCYCSFIP